MSTLNKGENNDDEDENASNSSGSDILGGGASGDGDRRASRSDQNDAGNNGADDVGAVGGELDDEDQEEDPGEEAGEEEEGGEDAEQDGERNEEEDAGEEENQDEQEQENEGMDDEEENEGMDDDGAVEEGEEGLDDDMQEEAAGDDEENLETSTGQGVQELDRRETSGPTAYGRLMKKRVSRDDDENNNDGSSSPLVAAEKDGVALDEKKELVRRKRRRLRKLFQEANGFPSFVGLLTANYDVSNEDDEEEDDGGSDMGEDEKFLGDTPQGLGDSTGSSLLQKRAKTISAGREIISLMKKFNPTVKKSIWIDVDVELGLKQAQAGGIPRHGFLHRKPVTVSPEHVSSILDNDFSPSRSFTAPAAVSSSSAAMIFTPKEEGWYEGVISPMSLPEDSIYLTELQQWVRQQLEFFSATELDAAQSSMGRRTRTTRGKVGIRCIHCARVALPQIEKALKEAKEEAAGSVASKAPTTISTAKFWPSGALSYPMNIAGIHSLCSQKPALHFNENCPNLPPHAKAQLARLTRDASGNTAAANDAASVGGNSETCASSGAGKRVTRRSEAYRMPTSVYYVVAAKRLGLVDVADGMRFARDLSLDPLPIETVRMQIEQEQLMSNSAAAPGSEPVLTGSSLNSTTPVEPRVELVDDEQSELVLAEAVATPDQPDKFLARSSDKALVTDYIFLIARQMAICHTLPFDFSTRGKKSKLMRIGLTGFCCRHCMEPGGAPPFVLAGGDTTGVVDAAGRFFASALEALTSSVLNSFASHLQKCYKVPGRIKKALAAYRKIHPKQMTQLVYGSQRRFFRQLWSRLREQDKTEEEMQEFIQAMPQPQVVEQSSISPVETKTVASMADSTYEEPFGSRPESFPVCEDPGTQQLLKATEENWDPSENDHLILPEDRNLVSDYVFLTMRQLKAAFPDTTLDTPRLRRGVHSSMVGLCCIHCSTSDQTVSPSGRSFPSAPDNFASALNTSFYNHMLVCPFISDGLKTALSNLRKIHSAQCSSLRFGSQRKFFTRLYARLRRMGSDRPTDTVMADTSAMPAESPSVLSPSQTPGKVPVSLAELGFIEIPPDRGQQQSQAHSTILCRNCRMVPVHFRVPGSMAVSGRHSVAKAREHAQKCKKDSFDLNLTVDALIAASHAMVGTLLQPQELLERESFQGLIREAVADNEKLFVVFTDGLLQVLRDRADKTGQQVPSITAAPSDDDDNNNDDADADEEVQESTSGLWKEFSSSVEYSKVAEAFERFAQDWNEGQGEEGDEISSDLRDHPALVSFLSLISLSLVVDDVVVALEQEEDDNEDEDDTEKPHEPDSMIDTPGGESTGDEDRNTNDDNLDKAPAEGQNDPADNANEADDVEVSSENNSDDNGNKDDTAPMDVDDDNDDDNNNDDNRLNEPQESVEEKTGQVEGEATTAVEEIEGLDETEKVGANDDDDDDDAQ